MTVSSGAVSAATPSRLFDAIVAFDSAPPPWAEWGIFALFVLGVVVLLYVAARPSPSETLNARNEREVEEARR